MKRVRRWIFVMFTVFYAFAHVSGVRAERVQAEICYCVEAEEKTTNEEYKEEKQNDEQEYKNKWIFDVAYGVVVLALAVAVGIRGEKRKRR